MISPGWPPVKLAVACRAAVVAMLRGVLRRGAGGCPDSLRMSALRGREARRRAAEGHGVDPWPSLRICSSRSLSSKNSRFLLPSRIWVSSLERTESLLVC